MSLLKDGRVIESFVSTHPEAECVADEYLFRAFALRELLDQFNRVADFAIQFRVT